jgi:hypothetical protein
MTRRSRVHLLALLLLAACAPPDPGRQAREPEPTLRFRPDGTFVLVHFTDVQDDQDIDPRTVRLIEAVLDEHRPDLVVFTGDNVREGPETPADVHRAVEGFAGPVESRGIPWAVTFGNHDEDHTPVTGMDEAALLDHYMSYPHNLNRPSPAGVHGTGNGHIVILGSQRTAPAFNVWLLDSGRYVPDTIAAQAVGDDGLRTYDWIRPSQVAWYATTSQSLERRWGAKVPSLMFFHIPLPEFALLWDHRENHSVTGEKNEDVAAGAFNSGLFGAVMDRGDVAGIFVGHDHVNDYVGDYFGVRLGYSANVGFGTYGLEGDDKDRMRGARVFRIREDDPRAFETFMVYARDYGIR